MGDPRVDAYIAKSPEFARPILEHLRQLMSSNFPEATETIKWGSPFWEQNGVLCGMSAFKNHAAFVLWNDKQIPEIGRLYVNDDPDSFGTLGKLRSLDDLPSDEILVHSVKLVMAYNEATKGKSPRSKSAEPAPVPDDFAAALRAHELAGEQFATMSTAKRNEYITWLSDAKTTATREKRMAQAIEWIAEGKGRNWKYER